MVAYFRFCNRVGIPVRSAVLKSLQSAGSEVRCGLGQCLANFQCKFSYGFLKGKAHKLKRQRKHNIHRALASPGFIARFMSVAKFIGLCNASSC